jgi:hypothetical protein
MVVLGCGVCGGVGCVGCGGCGGCGGVVVVCGVVGVVGVGVWWCGGCGGMGGWGGGGRAQWANYRGQADIGFFKIFDFMVDMASFNIQTNNKITIFQFSKKNVQKF